MSKSRQTRADRYGGSRADFIRAFAGDGVAATREAFVAPALSIVTTRRLGW
jgi:hypothetical protein